MDVVAEVYKEIYGCVVTHIPIRPGEKIHEKLDEGNTSDVAVRISKEELKALIPQP